MFINRKEEINYLQEVYNSKGARLLVMYGRRRVGKTELLRQFAKEKQHIFFTSDLSSEHEQLKQFSDRIYQATGDSFLKTQPFTSWEALLQYIFEAVIKKTSLIIIDEFPYLCVANRALPSILQKIWDEKTSSANIFLVLCGSYVSFMEKEVLSHKSPLFGRRTHQMHLQPFKFREIQDFFPNYTKEQKVYAYGILGGTPTYLLRFNDTKTIEENVKDEILNKNAMLYSEPRFLLMEELREPSTYFSILKSVATGKTRLNEIAQDTGLTDRHKVNKYLTVLRELRIINRDIPVTENIPHKSRKGIYTLEDPFFRFWFRYVYPHLSYLEEGDIEYVWNNRIKGNLNSFVGHIFENICFRKLQEINRHNQLPFKAKRIGRWWDKNEEIDIVAFNNDGLFLFCECKWTERQIGMNILDHLEKKSNNLTSVRKKYFGFFSKTGFTRELKDIAKNSGNILLFHLDEL